MKDHIFILLTSVNCFHCKGMRGNGMMGNKTFFMKPNTIESIFSKNDKIIFLNIHFLAIQFCIHQSMSLYFE